jgi:hypothetical protein
MAARAKTGHLAVFPSSLPSSTLPPSPHDTHPTTLSSCLNTQCMVTRIFLRTSLRRLSALLLRRFSRPWRWSRGRQPQLVGQQHDLSRLDHRVAFCDPELHRVLLAQHLRPSAPRQYTILYIQYTILYIQFTIYYIIYTIQNCCRIAAATSRAALHCAPGWPQDGPSMPGPSIAPHSIGDTIVLYHNGHETNKCTPNFDGNC